MFNYSKIKDQKLNQIEYVLGLCHKDMFFKTIMPFCHIPMRSYPKDSKI